MKTRESGMPDEAVWCSFFQPELVLDRLLLRKIAGDIVEFGCGYGTFTIPAARRAAGDVFALDIDPKMIVAVTAKAQAEQIGNVRPILRDFVSEGTGLSDSSALYAIQFNILHAEESPAMLREAFRVLAGDGLLGVVHWNYDRATPRGPSMEIRPRPEQIVQAAAAAGFRLLGPGLIDLPLWHYGMVFEKGAEQRSSSGRASGR